MRLLATVLLALFSLSVRASGPMPNAFVRLAVASLRDSAAHSSEMATQALMGTPVAIGAEVGDWYEAELPDGYKAYIHRTAFVKTDSAAMARWRHCDRLIGVSPFETHIYAGPSADSPVVSDFVMGCIVEGVKTSGEDFTPVSLPDGRHGWVRSDAVEPFDIWMNRPFDSGRVLRVAKSLTGSAYLWGGRSTKGTDCSGLTQLCYFDSGILLPRNASQQAFVGDSVDEPMPADLLFFANELGRVTHVAIADRDSLYVHSSGFVQTSSFDPAHFLYNGRTVTSMRRVTSAPRVAAHLWFFGPP